MRHREEQGRVKILIYTHSFAPQIGGVQRIVMSLAEGLTRLCAENGRAAAEVTLATPTPARGMNDDALPFRVVRQPRMGELVRLLREADIVHLAGPALLPLALAWIMEKRVVVEHHGFQTVCPNGQLFHEPSQTPCSGHFMAERHLECLRCNAKRGTFASLSMWLLTFLRRRLCELASANISPTTWLATVLQLPRTTTILHGLRQRGRDEANREPARPANFVFVGRLVGTKGVEVLLAAAQKLRNQGHVFGVKIIGDGPDRRKLEAKASSSGLDGHVEFLGNLADERMDDVIAGATAVVMPSLAGEVFGLVASEAMLRGRPVIASDIGALREVVGEDGLLFTPGDDCGLTGHMGQLLASAARAAELGRKASRRAMELFSEDRMAEQHFSLYGGVLPCDK